MVLPFVLAVELAGVKTRTLVGINVQVAFAIGESVCSVIGIRVKDWRDFQVIILHVFTVHLQRFAKITALFTNNASNSKMWTSLPLLVCLPIFLVLPESPRWLLKNGKVDSFLKVIKQGAKWNKVQFHKEEHLKRTILSTLQLPD